MQISSSVKCPLCKAITGINIEKESMWEQHVCKQCDSPLVVKADVSWTVLPGTVDDLGKTNIYKTKI